MNKTVQWARKKLPYFMRLNNQSFTNKGHPQEFVMLENMLANLYGHPLISLERSTYSPTGLRWKRNKDGLWARQRNEFLFANAKVALTARLYLPADYDIINKII